MHQDQEPLIGPGRNRQGERNKEGRRIDMHAGEQNLKRGGPGNPAWKKGKSGNPAGRPKGVKAIAEGLREIGDRPVDPWTLARFQEKYGPEHKPKTLHEGMLLAAHLDAMQGDAAARAFVAERTEGKVTDRLEVEDNTPSRVIFEEVRQGEAMATKMTTIRTIPRTE